MRFADDPLRAKASSVALALALLAAGSIFSGCNTPDPHFVLSTTPGGARRGAAVSILGVYKNGRMDPAAWLSVAPEVARALGGGCQPGFSADTLGRQGEWVAWLDRSTRQDGVTTDVLADLGPMARAPLILVLYLEEPDPNRPRGLGAERAPSPPESSSKSPPSPVGAPAGAISTPSAPPVAKRKIRTTWEPMPVHTYAIGASLYSVDQHEFIAEVGADATAENKKEAREGFFERLRRLLPNATCASWDWARDKSPPQLIDPASELPPRE